MLFSRDVYFHKKLSPIDDAKRCGLSKIILLCGKLLSMQSFPVESSCAVGRYIIILFCFFVFYFSCLFDVIARWRFLDNDPTERSRKNRILR